MNAMHVFRIIWSDNDPVQVAGAKVGALPWAGVHKGYIVLIKKLKPVSPEAPAGEREATPRARPGW